MTDRELLELAAKAAEIEQIQYQQFDAVMKHRYGMDCAIWTGETYWNPLEDDGDALRLAVKLDMEVNRNTGKVKVFDRLGVKPRCIVVNIAIIASCDLAATRRAIVRAAAVIGKQMENKE